MKKICFLFIALSISLSGFSQEIMFDAANPPFMYSGKGDAALGAYPDLFREVFSRMKANAKFIPAPWKRCLTEVDGARAGIAGIYMNEERIKKYDFSEAIFEDKLAVYTLKSRPINFSRVEDLYGKTIGVMRGWALTKEFDKAVLERRIKVEEVDNDLQNIMKLDAGRIEAFITIQETGDREIKKAGLEKRIIRLPTLLGKNPLFLAFNKKQNMLPFLQAFNDTLGGMKKDGSYEKIMKSHLD